MNIAAFGIGTTTEAAVNPLSYARGNERTVAAAIRGMLTPDLSSIELHIAEDIEAALGHWLKLETDGFGTLYQNALWCRAWLETVGAGLRVRPVIVAGLGADGRARFLLPLQIQTRHGVRVLEWLTSPHHNYGCGLYARDFMPAAASWFAANGRQMLAALPPHDAVALTEMPEEMFGHPNPLAPLFNSRAANSSFSLSLRADFEALYRERRSSERRRSDRKKEAALERLGELRFGLPAGKASLHTLIDTMFAQQEGRLAEVGIHGVFGTRERNFIHRLAELQDEDNPILAPYHLRCDGEVLSVMMGGIHGGAFWALISSLVAGPARRYSPGDVALRHTIEACCARGLSSFDFSSGDSAYKRSWADREIRLFNCIEARNFRGLAWTAAKMLKVSGKRLVKTQPQVYGAAILIRRLLLGRPVRR